MKPLCAECKGPLERDPDTRVIYCPGCGVALRSATSRSGAGTCLNCGRDLEFSAVLGVAFCPACDELLRPAAPKVAAPPPEPPEPPEPRAEQPAPAIVPAEPPAPERPQEAPPPEAAGDPVAALPSACRQGFTSEAHVEGECRVLSFQGQVGEREYGDFKAAVRRELDSDAVRLIVDLGETTYLSSSGLSVLIWAHGVMAEAGRRMIVVNVRPRTRQLLELISLEVMLEFADSVREAIELPDR